MKNNMKNEKSVNENTAKNETENAAKNDDNIVRMTMSKIGSTQIVKLLKLTRQDIPGLVYQVAGKIRKHEQTSKDFNGRISTSERFVGEFVVRFTGKDGVKYIVSSCRAFFPKVAEDMLVNAFDASVTANKSSSVNELIFSMEIEAHKDDTSSVGYVYVVKPIGKIRNSSEQLLALLDGTPNEAA